MTNRYSHLFPRATLCALTLSLSGAVLAQSRETGSIELSAQPRVIKSDGRSTTIITARVFVDAGRAAPDGTLVRFTTTNGTLDTVAAVTQGGVARVTLTSANQPGEANIVATLDAGAGTSFPARITVTFSADADNAQVDDNWIRIDGADYVGYAKDYQIIQANGKGGRANFTYRGVAISADIIQYSLETTVLLAKGGVTIQQGNEKRQYDQVLIKFSEGDGVAERTEDGKPIAFKLTGQALAETPWERNRLLLPTERWALADLSDASITIATRSVGVAPDGTMQFRRATFYVDGTKTLSMPYHVLNKDAESLYDKQIVGLGPQGFQVEFPYYFEVEPRAVSRAFLKRGARLSDSAYSNRPGWWVDVERRYNTTNGSSGVMEFLGLTRPDWSARFNHEQRLDPNTTARFYADFPFHRDVFLNTRLTRNFKGFSLNTNVTANQYRNLTDPVTGEQGKTGGDINGNLVAETRQRPIAGIKQVQYTMNATVGRQSYYGNGVLVRGTFNYETLGTRINTSALPIAKGATFTQSLSLGQTWLQGSGSSVTSRAGITASARSAVRKDFNPNNSGTVSYDYSESPQQNYGISSIYAPARHRVGLNLLVGEPRFATLNLNGSRGLDRPQTSLDATLYVPFSHTFHGRVQHFFSEIGGIPYRETQLSLIINIEQKKFKRQFTVYYSTTARRFQFDLSGIGF